MLNCTPIIEVGWKPPGMAFVFFGTTLLVCLDYQSKVPQNNRNGLPYSSRGWKLKIKVLAEVISLESSDRSLNQVSLLGC